MSEAIAAVALFILILGTLYVGITLIGTVLVWSHKDMRNALRKEGITTFWTAFRRMMQ